MASVLRCCASFALGPRVSAAIVIQARSGATWIKPSPDVTTTSGGGDLLSERCGRWRKHGD